MYEAARRGLRAHHVEILYSCTILRMPCRSGFDLDRLRAMRAHLLAMGRYGPGVTYTVPRWATINAPPPMGPLFGIWHDVYWSHESAFTAPP